MLDQATLLPDTPDRSRRQADGTPEPSSVQRALEPVDAFVRNPSIGESARGELALVRLRAAMLPDVQSGQSDDDTRVLGLLKSMQIVLALARESHLEGDGDYPAQLSQIWTVLFEAFNALGTSRYAVTLKHFAHVYQVQSRLDLDALAPLDADMAPVDPASLQERMEQACHAITQAYDPILDPADFIRRHIERGVQAFAAKHGRSGDLTASSPVVLTLTPLAHPNPSRHGARAPLAIERTFTLAEIVSGQHHHVIKAMRDPSGRMYSITAMSHQDVVDALACENLQTVMEQALTEYEQSDKKTMLEAFNRKMVVRRCLAYLVSPQAVPLYAAAVQRFLAGSAHAMSLIFQGQGLNGAFCIPVEEGRALILSVDEPIQFHTAPVEHGAAQGGFVSKHTLPRFPRSTSFRDWLFAKVPARHAMKYAHDAKALFDRPHSMALSPLGSVFTRNTPAVEFGEPIAHQALASHLTTAWLSRLREDIDTLIFSDAERISLQALELAKIFLSLGSAVVATAYAGTGGLLSRIVAFIAVALSDSAVVAASIVQGWVADDPAEIEGYCYEAVLAFVFAASMNAFDGVLLARRGASTVMTVSEFRSALSHYRHLDGAMRDAFHSVVQRGLQRAGHAAPSAGARARNGMRVPGRADAAGSVEAVAKWRKIIAQRQRTLLGNVKVLDSGAYFYPTSPSFSLLLASQDPRIGAVGYRTVGRGDYVQLYTEAVPGGQAQGSSTLVVSSHGGFTDQDVGRSIVPLPAGPVLQLLAPHGVQLIDPSIHRVINDPTFKAYLTIDGTLSEVNVIPQSHARWFLGDDFDPHSAHARFGSNRGLMNYHHTQFEYEGPKDIATAIHLNREMALRGEVDQADVLVVNDTISNVRDIDLSRASVQKVLDLDQAGALLNERGQRYGKIILCHCRNNIQRDSALTSEYDALGTLLSGPDAQSAQVIEQTTLTLDPVTRLYRERTALVAVYLYITVQQEGGTPQSTA